MKDLTEDIIDLLVEDSYTDQNDELCLNGYCNFEVVADKLQKLFEGNSNESD
jgi:hypothetical protein